MVVMIAMVVCAHACMIVLVSVDASATVHVGSLMNMSRIMIVVALIVVTLVAIVVVDLVMMSVMLFAIVSVV